MRKSRLRTVRLTCIAVVCCAAICARAETLTVGVDGAQFHTVAEAIASAREGDTIRVHTGTYDGALELDRKLTLEGVGRPVLRGTGRGSVLVVTADSCVIRGFVVERSGSDLTREDSGILLKSSRNRIEENELRDVLYGIYLYGSRENVLRANLVRGRIEVEMGERGAGLHLWNSPDNLIEDNVITDTRDGMYIQSSSGNRILRNRVSRLRYGLHYMSSDGNVFQDNVFSDNVAGAAIMYSNRIELRRNAFVRNRGFSSFGILFQDCTEYIAEDNLIADNGTGIFAEALRHSTFRRNTVAANDAALMIYGSSSENTFASNNFVGNLSPLQLVGRPAATRWAEDGRGNYWGDYEGYDLNADGVGDVAHKVQNVFEHMEGQRPRLRVYLGSPAAQALASAEKAFPILRGSREADPAPLTRAVETAPVAFERRAQASGAARVALTLTYLTMLCLSAAVIWRGQRRTGGLR